MIKTAVAEGQNSSLNHLLVAIPNVYLDVVDALCSLFALQNFRLLSVELSTVCPLMLSKLLRAFIMAPCPQTHKLLIHVTKEDNQIFNESCMQSLKLKQNQVAAMDMHGVTIPSCGLQHKALKFSSTSSLSRGFYVLLQYPEIRLKELTLFSDNEYLHLCATHLHLQLTKLVIFVGNHRWQRRQSSTLQEDILYD